MITNILFIDPDHNNIRVETDEGLVFNSLYPCTTYHRTEIEEWLMSNQITSFNDQPKHSYAVSKLVIVDRLYAAGLLEIALVALEQNFYLHQRWQAASWVESNDQSTREFITLLGADPDVILAP